jgi:hypothetical protein
MRPAEHGKDWAYRKGCRCDICRTGNTQRSTQQKVRAVPGTCKLHTDFDAVVVSRALSGQKVPLGIAERAAAIDILDALGLSAAEIARRIGCCCRTVRRRRRANRVRG